MNSIQEYILVGCVPFAAVTTIRCTVEGGGVSVQGSICLGGGVSVKRGSPSGDLCDRDHSPLPWTDRRP